MALYVYGLMRADEAARAVAAPRGRAASLMAVEHGGLSALVTPVRDGPLRLRRERLRGHADVLQDAFAHGPVLPLRFGTGMPSEQAVIANLLEPGHNDLRERLDALVDMAELQVKATYVEAPLLRSVLASDIELAHATARIRTLPPEATHFERIRIGEAIAQAVERRRAADSGALLDPLREHAAAYELSEPQHERMALNAAFLVQRGQLDGFDAAVEVLADSFAGQVQFKVIGPMPAYSFAGGGLRATRTGGPGWG